MGGCKKSKKWGGVFFCKKVGPFLDAGCIMYSISIFLFYILLIWGCVPLPTALHLVVAVVLSLLRIEPTAHVN